MKRLVVCFRWRNAALDPVEYFDTVEQGAARCIEAEGTRITWGADRFCFEFAPEQLASVLKICSWVLTQCERHSAGISVRELAWRRTSEGTLRAMGPALALAEALAVTANSGEILVDPEIDAVRNGSLARSGSVPVKVSDIAVDAALVLPGKASLQGFFEVGDVGTALKPPLNPKLQGSTPPPPPLRSRPPSPRGSLPPPSTRSPSTAPASLVARASGTPAPPQVRPVSRIPVPPSSPSAASAAPQVRSLSSAPRSSPGSSTPPPPSARSPSGIPHRATASSPAAGIASIGSAVAGGRPASSKTDGATAATVDAGTSTAASSAASSASSASSAETGAATSVGNTALASSSERSEAPTAASPHLRAMQDEPDEDRESLEPPELSSDMLELIDAEEASPGESDAASKPEAAQAEPRSSEVVPSSDEKAAAQPTAADKKRERRKRKRKRRA